MTNLSKFIFGNSQLSPPLGIRTEQMRPGKSADSVLTILCLVHIELGIQEPILGVLAILKNRVFAMNIILPEHIRQLDTQQWQ